MSPVAVEEPGTTAEEQRERSLDRRLAMDEPDASPTDPPAAEGTRPASDPGRRRGDRGRRRGEPRCPRGRGGPRSRPGRRSGSCPPIRRRAPRSPRCTSSASRRVRSGSLARMTGTRLAIVFSLAAGIAGAAQASISGALGRRVGTIGSAGFGVILAAVLVIALAVALGRGGSIVAALHAAALAVARRTLRRDDRPGDRVRAPADRHVRDRGVADRGAARRGSADRRLRMARVRRGSPSRSRGSPVSSS